jgi:hypothetical protein
LCHDIAPNPQRRVWDLIHNQPFSGLLKIAANRGAYLTPITIVFLIKN